MADGPSIPVVCVHGALRSRAGMWPAAAYLRRLGFEARTFGYATRRETLEQHATRLRTFMDAWLCDRDLPVVGFVTHSMGALVVRAYLGLEPTSPGWSLPSARQRLVMLSPPNQGSQLARKNASNPAFQWLYGEAARELSSGAATSLPPLPRSADVLVLAGGTGENGYNPLIDGDDDGVVAVDEMGLPGIDPTFVGGVHGLLQWRPLLLRRAAGFIRTGTDGPAGASPEHASSKARE